jgi:signal transduction histidine kinase
MAEEPLRLLLIEDNEVYRQLIRGQLESVASGTIALESTDRLASGLERLSQGGVDAVLLDLLLPDSSGIDTLWKTLAHAPDVPVVVLTALDDEELALSAVKGGAQDYLGKEQVTGEMIVRSVRYAIERKSLISRLEDSLADLERNNEDLGQFAAAATRILQPPIDAISRTCEFLLQHCSNQLGESARERLAGGHEGLAKMRRLIEDFLAYIRIAVYRPDAREETDCGAALAEVLEKLGREIEATGAQVTHDRLPVVGVDRSQVVLLFENLLSNAIKYRREVPLEFHLGASREGDMWAFSARDNGLGIDPEYPDQIFELFPGFETEAEAGRGVGLAICKRIVTNHGGDIWVESAWGEGSIFRFRLPAKRVP